MQGQRRYSATTVLKRAWLLLRIKTSNIKPQQPQREPNGLRLDSNPSVAVASAAGS